MKIDTSVSSAEQRAIGTILRVMGERARLHHARMLQRSFMHEMQSLPRLSFWGLAHWKIWHPVTATPLPWGWRVWRELDRNQKHIMPLWLYVFVDLWDRRWTPVDWMIRRGWLVGREGDYYRNFRPRWWPR